MLTHPRRRFAAVPLVFGTGFALFASGCHQRTIAITSEPPGALVWLNDVQIGRTPVEAGFTFFGDYDVRLRKEGYEPLMTHRVANAPWYEYAPIDLVVLALPWRTETRIEWHFELPPLPTDILPPEQVEEQLLDRADELRDRVRGSDD